MSKSTYSEYRQAIKQFFDDARGRANQLRVTREAQDLHDFQEIKNESINVSWDTNLPRRYRPASAHRLRIYTALTEPSMGIFIDDAKQLLKQKYLSGFRHWTHEYTIDIVNVRTRLLGRLGFVTITPVDQFEFEFASSANPIQQQTVTGAGGFNFQLYNGVHIRTHVESVNGAMAITSTVAKNRRTVIGGSDTSVIARYYQVNLFDEPVSYVDPVDRFDRLRYNKTLMESWAPKSPHTGVHLRGVTLGMSVGLTPDKQPLSPHVIRDIDFDIPFQKNNNTDNVTTAFLRIDADWPRANGIQKVKSDIIGITRDFAIYVDAFNQFFVFPVEAIQPIDPLNPYAQNVDNAYVTMLTPTIPAWCFQQTSKASDLPSTDVQNGKWQVDAPEPDWKFDHEGKRAVSIFYERVPYTYDSALFTGPDANGALDPFTQAEFDAAAAQLGVQSRQQATFVSGYHEQRYGIAPGIIEVVITIALTGESLNMYTASIEVRELRRPTTSEYCPMFVGYVWYDVPFGAKVVKDPEGKIVRDDRIAKAGDLVSLDVERYINTAGNSFQIFSIKKLDVAIGPLVVTETEILPLTIGPLLAVDLTSLSMVLGLSYMVDETGRSYPAKVGEPSYPGRRTDIQWRTQHFGAWAIIGAKHAEFLWPKLVPQEIRDQATFLKDTVTKTYWRGEVDKALVTDPTYYRLALNDPRDWSYGNYGAYRKWWLESFPHYLGNVVSHPFPADGTEIGNFIFGGLRVWINASHLMYTANPKLAWYAYADLICTYHIGGANTTFYVHPNGTWCFFCNHLVYLPMGLPHNNTGAFVEVVSTYDIIDNVTIEHIIYDRVHFEMRTKKGLIARKDTTFQALYNIAVNKGLAAHSLESNISPIEDKDLRATFEKNVYTYPTPPISGITWLDLKATWDGTSYWMPETAIQGGQYYSLSGPISGQQKVLGLSFGDTWWTGAGYTGSLVFPETNNYHIRFANPIVLQTVR